MSYKNSIIAIALLSAVVFASYAPAAHAQVANVSTLASLQAQLVSLQSQLSNLKRTTNTDTVKTVTTDTDAAVEIKKVTSSKKPSISGIAEDMDKLYVTVTKDGEDKAAFKKTVKVSRSDKWSARVTRSLPDGAYTVEVFSPKDRDEALATKTFTVGKATSSKAKTTTAANGTFSVSLLPLLMGGTARANQAVPVSYLKVTNTGKEAATLTGVTLAQRGTAAASAVTSLTLKDDKDGSQGLAKVSGTTTTVPTTSEFAPGQMKLFTVKAVMAANAGSQFGKTLQYEVTGVTGGKGAFPIKGTTWTIGF